MIAKVYKEALEVLAKKPFRLWGISVLSSILCGVLPLLCGVVIPALGMAVWMLLSTGMLMVYLHGFRCEQVEAVQMFDCFKDWGTIRRVLCGLAWEWLWLFIWFIIPVVGPVFAVIKAYSWSLVPYILVQEPDIAPTQALKVSQMRTEGYKAMMFGADALYAIAIGIVGTVFSLLCLIPFLGILFIPANLLLYAIGILFIGLVHAGFYEEIMSKTNAVNTQSF